MRKTTIILLAILILLLVVVACFSVPLPGGKATYTPVSAQPVGYLYIVTNTVRRPAPWLGKAPDYFVENGELYLRNRTTQYALLLVTINSRGISSESDIQSFRRDHPELESYWPEPEKQDGGVAWTRERISSKLQESINSGKLNPQQ